MEQKQHPTAGQPTTATIDMGSGDGGSCDVYFSDEPLQSGRLINDRYVLSDILGCGGMGTVWRAEQIAPIKRTVAIKFLRHDRTSRNVIARFSTEHQALAALNHPHIAKVFDGGETEDSLPFLVMELVSGMPVTDYADQQRVTVNQRLKLFTTICSAIEHAHQRGIIHRDLKPSNVLVSCDHGAAAPKVIDFGLAKALPWANCGEPTTAVTAPGVILGTPSYMSPEQISASEPNADTRSDVYALGVILYELIAGELPFVPASKEEGGWLETFRRITQDAPQRPSTRIKASEQLTERAAARGESAQALIQEVRGDLDWIILKALQKNPSHRYESVAALRRDIESLLASLPVEAHPPSLKYTAEKFFMRHRWPVLGTLVGMVALFLAIAVSTWGLIRARNAEMELRAALHSERLASAKSKRALAAIAEGITLLALSKSGDETALLNQVVLLHDISADDGHGHDVSSVGLGNCDGASPKADVYRKVLSVLEHLNHERRTPDFQFVQAVVRFRLACLLDESGCFAEARSHFWRCKLEFTQLAQGGPLGRTQLVRLMEMRAELATILSKDEYQESPQG